MLRLTTPSTFVAGFILFMMGVGVFLDAGVGVGAVGTAKRTVGGGAMREGRVKRMEPKFQTPLKPHNRRRHDWDTSDKEGESPRRNLRTPKKSWKMAAEEKHRREVEKQEKMEKRMRMARGAGQEGEWKNEGDRRRGRRRRRKVRRVEKEGGRKRGQNPQGNVVNNGRRAAGKVKFSKGTAKKLSRKSGTEKDKKEKVVKEKPKLPKHSAKPKKADGKKEKGNKNKDKKGGASGEETYVLGEMTKKFTSKSKGECVGTEVISGKDSVVVYTTAQKKRSTCKIRIRFHLNKNPSPNKYQ
ncbi:eukaryotic translation initiation factor 5B-like [Penaeus japonicus]|uniref:eukaryotic translation initiation factor 5B-like n=1 Tax=Penaeus japonicus TaxID=27405 RepID=UPI001C71620B|nr:eukaryotic translation initiation factor 5B-like [Penaeus japonicus]